MGQAQSEVGAAPAIDQTQSQHSSSVRPHNYQLESLLIEAAAYGDDENEKALECPCIADLRNSSCGVEFSDAFLCFLKSTVEEKEQRLYDIILNEELSRVFCPFSCQEDIWTGSDCVHPFVALQNCIKANPNAFSKDISEKEVKKEEAPPQEYRIIPLV